MKDKIKEGSKVKVLRIGDVCDVFDIMAREMKLKKWEDGWPFRNDYNSLDDSLGEGRIISIKKYNGGISKNNCYYGVFLKSYNKDIITTINNLELLKNKIIIPDKLFEL